MNARGNLQDEVASHPRCRTSREKFITPSIFISYRRSDSGGWAQLLFSSLKHWLDHDELFLDVVSLAPGCNFEAEIEAAIHNCIGLVAMIGPDWLNGINKPDDWVRREIRTALCKDKPILPVFVAGQSAPRASDIPIDIQPAILQSRGVHLDPYACPPNADAIADWASRIAHDLELIGIRFHRTWVPASHGHKSGAFYLSEELLTVGCWAARLQTRLPGFNFDAERDSTSAAVRELLLEIDRSMRCDGIRGAQIDLPFLDELQRAAQSEHSFFRAGAAANIVQTIEQLCRHREKRRLAAISMAAEAASRPGLLVTRWTVLSEPGRPIHLVLRSAKEATRHGA